MVFADEPAPAAPGLFPPLPVDGEAFLEVVPLGEVSLSFVVLLSLTALLDGGGEEGVCGAFTEFASRLPALAVSASFLPTSRLSSKVS